MMYLRLSDGSGYHIINQYMIAPYKQKYLKMDASFVSEGEIIEAPLLDHCDDCGKLYEERPVRVRFFSEDPTLNHKLNRPGRVCAICYYRPYYESGVTVPAPLRSFF